MAIELQYQTRDEMDFPTNPLQRLRETFAFASMDCGMDKMIAFLYGVILGWDETSYEELKERHGWSDKDVELQKMWHNNYNEAWRLYMDKYGKSGKYIGYGSSSGLASAVDEAISDLPDFTHINIVKGMTMSGDDWYECVVTKSTHKQ